jgi:bacterioferritin (cytochrome b1)
VRPGELLSLLQDLYGDRLRLVNGHQVSAGRIGQYEFNNTYQYVIAREETHLQWLAEAIVDLGGSVPAEAAPEPSVGSEHDIIARDLEGERAFVERWRARVATLTNVRHRKMLELVLGESLEHARFFEEAVAGHKDLLGRSCTGAGQRGTVLATRWIE